MPDTKGQKRNALANKRVAGNIDFVLEKAIFSNVFDKDIQRIYIYKKAERLAKAVHAVAPGLADSPALRERAEAAAVALVDAAVLPPASARERLPRELLTLSSVLAIAEAAGRLSSMNAGLIVSEAQYLLAEVAGYEAPRLALEAVPSFAGLARRVAPARRAGTPRASSSIGQLKDTPKNSGRREAILGVIRERGRVYIREIATVVREVSEKTIQRELAALVREGVVAREGERRWTLYSLA
jgi:DNA-binding transcriptional ArsR family regulator